jgi:hypothetical protein
MKNQEGGMRSASALVLLAIISTTAFGQEFYLQLDQTGKKYGPYDFEDGAKVQLGQGVFTVVTGYRAESTEPELIDTVTVPAAPDTAPDIIEPEPDPAAIMAEVMKEERKRSAEEEPAGELETPVENLKPVEDRAERTAKRLRKTKIERYVVRKVSLRTAIKYLAYLVNEEAGRKDYPIEFALATDDDSAPNAARNVSLSLKKVRAEDVMKQMADLTAYAYRVEDNKVIFSYSRAGSK